jgi:hypothetical protein
VDTNDVIDLLTIVAVADKRTIGEADVVLWEKLLGHLDKDDCTDAIMAFRGEQPGVWLEPGHILQRVKAKRRDELDRMNPDDRPKPLTWGSNPIFAQQSSLPPGSPFGPASEESRAAALAEISRILRKDVTASGDDAFDGVVRHAFTIRCKFCKAGPHEECTAPSGRGKRSPLKNTAAHPTRVKMAALALGYDEVGATAMEDLVLMRGAKRVKASLRPSEMAMVIATQAKPEKSVEASTEAS